MSARRRPAFLAVLLLASLASTAGTAGFVQNEFAFGPDGFRSDSFEFSIQVATNWATAANYSFHTNKSLTGVVSSAEFLVSRYHPTLAVGLRGVVYPRGNESESAGGTLILSRTIPDDTEGTWSQMGLILSGFSHRFPHAGPLETLSRRTLTEYAAEANIRQTYFNQFQFSLSGTGFFYSADPKEFTEARPTFNQLDAGSLGALRAMTELPLWSARFQMARALDPPFELTNVIMSYSRTEFSFPGTWANSYLAGLGLRHPPHWFLDLTGNIWHFQGAQHLPYYSAVLRYAW